MFIWCTGEESRQRAQAKKTIIDAHIAQVMAHLICLADMINLDVVVEFEQKMKKNAEKYPVELAAGEKYADLKDQYRKR